MSTADVNLLPSGFKKPEASGTYAVTSIESEPFFYSSENPEPYDARLWWVKDADDNQHIMLDGWYDKDGAVTDSNGFVMMDERLKLDYHVDITIASSASNFQFTVANATTHGLSAATDYYLGWRLEFYDDASGLTKYTMVIGYSVTAGTATFTVHDDIGTDWTNWVTFNTGCHLYLRRWFHSKAARSIGWGAKPGTTYASEGRVRGCGGAASTASYEPWWLGYLDRTFFKGIQGYGVGGSTDDKEFNCKGTYVDDLEVTGDTIAELVSASEIPIVYYGGTGTDAAKDFDTAIALDFNYTLEYDGYQESRLYECGGGDVTPSTNYRKLVLSIHLATLSKRVTAINLYAQQYAGGFWSDNYFIRRVPIGDDTALASWKFRQADLPFANAHETASLFTIDGVTIEHPYAQLTGPDWDSRGATYYDRTGRVEPFDSNHVWTESRDIVCWDYAENLAGRMFYGNYYDPNEAVVISDYIRFTGFNSGVSSYDIIPYDRLNYEIEVFSGDSGSINGIKADKDFLYIFKDDSIHSVYINADPTTWVRSTISSKDGNVSPKSLLRLPGGGICFADNDHYKVVMNQRIINLTEQLKDTYYALSGKTSIISWYDKIDDAICFTNGVDTTGAVHYRGYKRGDGIFWYKIVLPVNHYPEFVSTDRLENVYFTNNHASGFQGFFKWARATYLFGGASIVPYFLTHQIILDESVHVLLDKFIITKNGVADSGTLDIRAYADAVLSQAWTANSKSATSLYLKLSPLSARQGRRIQLEYNYNASGETCSDDHIQIDAVDIYGEAIRPPEWSR